MPVVKHQSRKVAFGAFAIGWKGEDDPSNPYLVEQPLNNSRLLRGMFPVVLGMRLVIANSDSYNSLIRSRNPVCCFPAASFFFMTLPHTS